MIYFSFRETLLSLLYAVIYGVCFSVIRALAGISVITLRSVALIPYDSFFYKSITDERKGRIKEKSSSSIGGQVLAALWAFLFGFGFLILSYYALDGELRLYLLAACIAAYILTCRLTEPLKKFVGKVISRSVLWLTRISRIAVFPFRFIIIKICRFFKKLFEIFMYIIKKRRADSLDKNVN